MTLCRWCGEEAAETVDESNYDYSMVGVPVVVVSGIRRCRCPACGEWSIRLRSVDRLHQAIAHAVVRRALPLSSVEARWLLGWMDLTDASAARRLGVAPEQLSRWGEEDGQVSATAERQLRRLVLEHAGPVKTVADCADRRPSDPVRVTWAGDGWAALVQAEG